MSAPEERSPDGGQDFVSEAEAGTKFHTRHLKRTVKIYSIQEFELRSVTRLNAIILIATSTGAALLTYLMGLGTEALMQETISPTGWILLKVVGPICGVLCMGCFGIAGWAYKTRKTDLDQILEESKVEG